MKEYYIETNSFAAPFVSDTGYKYVEAASPKEALEKCAAEYRHPAGLFAAAAYDSADAKNKGQEPLARWLCNHEQAKQRLTKSLGCCSYLGHAPGDFEIDGKRHKVENPKGGCVIS